MGGGGQTQQPWKQDKLSHGCGCGNGHDVFFSPNGMRPSWPFLKSLCRQSTETRMCVCVEAVDEDLTFLPFMVDGC